MALLLLRDFDLFNQIETLLLPSRSMIESYFGSSGSEKNQISNLILFHALLPELWICRHVALADQ
jgi:hypothetical protein